MVVRGALHIVFDLLNEFSHDKSDVKNPSRGRKTLSGRKMYNVLSLRRENGIGTNYLVKAISPKKQKRTQTVVRYITARGCRGACICIEERLNEGPRFQ